jgi:hypothetical protein
MTANGVPDFNNTTCYWYSIRCYTYTGPGKQARFFISDTTKQGLLITKAGFMPPSLPACTHLLSNTPNWRYRVGGAV